MATRSAANAAAGPLPAVAPPGRDGRVAKGEAARGRILAAAEAAFAEQGFAGASLRGIGAAIGMGNAALLHHFPNKRRLYAAVLQAIADELQAVLSRPVRGADLHGIAGGFLDWSVARPQAATLILRELLDNPARAERARSWPMQPLMRQLEAAAAQAARGGPMDGQDPMIIAFQVIGAIAYVTAGRRTIAALMDTAPETVIDRLRAALHAQIDAITAAPRAGAAATGGKP